MAESGEDAIKRLKASHGAIEEALQGHMNELEIDGVLTNWVIVAAITAFEDGDELDCLYTTQSDGISKWTHIGMLTSALDSTKRDGVYGEDI